MGDVLKSLKISLDSSESLLVVGGIGVLGLSIPLLVGGYMFGGAAHTPFQTLFQKPEYLIKGSVESGYEEVCIHSLLMAYEDRSCLIGSLGSEDI